MRHGLVTLLVLLFRKRLLVMKVVTANSSRCESSQISRIQYINLPGFDSILTDAFKSLWLILKLCLGSHAEHGCALGYRCTVWWRERHTRKYSRNSGPSW